MSETSDMPRVTLSAARAGMAVTAAGLVGFLVLAVAVIALNGLNIVTGVIALAALASTAVILFDLPVSVTMDESGIRRSTPLRQHRIEWGEIDQLVRMRRGGLRRPGSGKYRGIVAVRGRKRTVLVDRNETIDEHARLRVVFSAALDADRYEALLRQFPSAVIDPDTPTDG